MRAAALVVLLPAIAFADPGGELCRPYVYAEPSIFLGASGDGSGGLTRTAFGLRLPGCFERTREVRIGLTAHLADRALAGDVALGAELEINSPVSPDLRLGGRFGYEYGGQESHLITFGARLRVGDTGSVGIDGFFQNSTRGSTAGAMIGVGLEGWPGWAVAGVEVVLSGVLLYGVLNESSH
jgi:hypothetical protein